MIITSIKAQLKTPDRYSIFVDGRYSFSLSGNALLEHRLKVGQVIDKPALKNLKLSSSNDKLYNLTLKYALSRPHSKWEVEFYLRRKKTNQELAQQFLNKLEALRLVDDFNFAKSWVENRRLLKPVSRLKLIQELRTKRVDEEIINQVLSDDQTNETEVLKQLINKKRVQSKYQDDIRLMRYLAGKGFKYDDIKSALKNTDND